jgi:hypothetical protein
MATQLPLAIVRFDYGQKVLKFECFVKLTGNVDADYAYLQKMYEGVEGFHIDNAAPIKPLPARDVQK